jgi:hypothetical protein
LSLFDHHRLVITQRDLRSAIRVSLGVYSRCYHSLCVYMHNAGYQSR